MNNNDSYKNIIIVILILVIIGLSSVCVYFALDRNNKDNNNDEQIETEDKEGNITGKFALTETEKNKFMDEIIPVLDRTQFTVTDYSKGKLNDVQKIEFAILASNKLGQNVSYNDLLKVSKKYLGDDGAFLPQDISGCTCGKHFYQYNSTDKIFYSKLSEHGHGLGSEFPSPRPDNYFVEGEVTKENGQVKTIEIKVRKSFVAIGDLVSALYRFGTYEDAKQNKNLTVELPHPMNDNDIIEHIKNNPNKYPIHTYLFEYENEEYHLVSISVEK